MEIVPTPKGSRLTITERGEIYNPIFRTLAKFRVRSHRTMESCLKAAQKKLAVKKKGPGVVAPGPLP